MGAYKRYREFGGKGQRVGPRVGEFREFGPASLRGITVINHTQISVDLISISFWILIVYKLQNQNYHAQHPNVSNHYFCP